MRPVSRYCSSQDCIAGILARTTSFIAIFAHRPIDLDAGFNLDNPSNLSARMTISVDKSPGPGLILSVWRLILPPFASILVATPADHGVETSPFHNILRLRP